MNILDWHGFPARDIVAGIGMLFSATVLAEIPQPNGQYGGGTVIDYPQSGVSYVLPSNAFGITSPTTPDAELIVGVLPHFRNGDNGLFIQVGVADFQAVAHEMGATVQFMGAHLEPLGEPRVGDDFVYNDFQYVEDGKVLRAFMLLMSLENDGAVMFVASAPSQIIQIYKDVAMDVARSVKVSIPVTEESSQAEGGTTGAPRRPVIDQSQNGSVVMGEECSFVSSGGMTMKICD